MNEKTSERTSFFRFGSGFVRIVSEGSTILYHIKL